MTLFNIDTYIISFLYLNVNIRYSKFVFANSELPQNERINLFLQTSYIILYEWSRLHTPFYRVLTLYVP